MKEIIEEVMQIMAATLVVVFFVIFIMVGLVCCLGLLFSACAIFLN